MIQLNYETLDQNLMGVQHLKSRETSMRSNADGKFNTKTELVERVAYMLAEKQGLDQKGADAVAFIAGTLYAVEQASPYSSLTAYGSWYDSALKKVKVFSDSDNPFNAAPSDVVMQTIDWIVDSAKGRDEFIRIAAVASETANMYADSLGYGGMPPSLSYLAETAEKNLISMVEAPETHYLN